MIHAPFFLEVSACFLGILHTGTKYRKEGKHVGAFGGFLSMVHANPASHSMACIVVVIRVLL